ncbi:caspase family protein [Rhodobacter sp. Har01]|uniref:caspase family protein n=1 Tax=Rhodobacter sp. Har01 TaxID=2883999 RepID=UPI001D0708F2|nr:caspase family protein [Rhodobacter sp. Har01]MCB6179593.1 caspase family protein [Rhodobacter sp. Har01]
MIRKLLLTTAFALLALPAAARENYAILIAANDYQNLDERWWLKGPRNDVDLVATYLTTEAPVPFAPENVTVLTDGTEGAQPATLAAIREAFAKVAAEAQPGDFVYLHFSGHGTQAPATNDDTELDGLDELFLPVDIGKWNDGVGTVQNALVDDEIGQMIDAIRAKGADVWVVFDSCHSGTATRAVEADDEVRTRQLDPSVLGMDPAAMEDVASRSIGEDDPRATTPEEMADTAPAGEGLGSFVAFYAAQTNEVTPEKNMPKGKPGRKPHGVFTYTLFETLAEYPSATYGQLGQEILRKYSVTSIAKTTPLFEGDLDAVAFAGAEGGRVAQWPAEATEAGLTIPAGELHGLSQGAVLAVMATAADATENALGYVEITSIDTFTATATAIEQDGKVLPADLPKGLYLRKLDDALDFTLTVALPEPGTAPADALLAALEDLKAEAGPRLNFVAAGAEADLRLAVIPDSPRPDAIWVLPSTGLADDLTTTPSVGTEGKDGATLALTLADTLAHMSKALNLMKLGGAIGAGEMDVEVEMLTRSAETPELTPLPLSPVPTLISNDEVHVLAKNHMDVPVDVNVLYIGADYSITHWAAERLQPGDELKKGLFAIGGQVMGQERMIVIITPAKPQSPVENLGYLAQDALETSRGLAGSAFGDALTEAGFGETTRGAVALSGPEEDTGPAPMILQLELRTKAVD